MSNSPDWKPINGGRDHAEPYSAGNSRRNARFAARNLEQAKFVACDKFMEAVQTAMSAFEGRSLVAQPGAREAGKNVMNFAQQNVATAFDYGQKLMLAKDPQTLLALNSEFISARMRAFWEQATTVRQKTSAR